MNQLLGPDLVPGVAVVVFAGLVGFVDLVDVVGFVVPVGFVAVAPCVLVAPCWFDVAAAWPLFPGRALVGAEELVLG